MIKPRILFNAKDFPGFNSGYGIIGRYLLPLLGEHYGKENIIIYAPIYQRDTVTEWEGMKVLPGISWDYGENLILEHYQHERCNLLLQVGDAWPLGIVPDLASNDEILWVQWIPVDWLGMPKNIINRIRPAHKLVPFSKYGENSLRKHNFTNVEKAIWIGLNTDLWRPAPRDEQVMELLGFGNDTFNLLIVAANQERKGIFQQLEAIRLLRQVDPDIPLRLYLHTQMRGDRDLYADVDELGIGDILVYPDPYLMKLGGIKEEEMVKIFNCADVLLNVCFEGFGISMTQAQACGVPVIYLLEGPGDELVVSGIGTTPIANVTHPNMMTTPLPNPMAIAQSLAELWKRRVLEGVPMRSEGATQFVQDNLSWGKIAEQWFEVIDKVMWERERYCMDIPSPSEELLTKAGRMRELE